MRRARVLSVWLGLALAGSGLVVPTTARADEVPGACTGISRNGGDPARCHFACVRGTAIDIVVQNLSTTAAVDGTARCGAVGTGPWTTMVTSSGLAPPDNIGHKNVVMGQDYVPNPAVEPHNCFSIGAPSARIRITCRPAAVQEKAPKGGAPATGSFVASPGWTFAGTASSFGLTASAAMTVADPFTAQAFAGTVTISINGASDFNESCLLGQGQATLSLSSTSGAGSLNVTGTGSYFRLSDNVKFEFAPTSAWINGVPSDPGRVVVAGKLIPVSGTCGASPMTAAVFAGAVTVGV